MSISRTMNMKDSIAKELAAMLLSGNPFLEMVVLGFLGELLADLGESDDLGVTHPDDRASDA